MNNYTDPITVGMLFIAFTAFLSAAGALFLQTRSTQEMKASLDLLKEIKSWDQERIDEVGTSKAYIDNFEAKTNKQLARHIKLGHSVITLIVVALIVLIVCTTAVVYGVCLSADIL